jgi:hypothetical protein
MSNDLEQAEEVVIPSREDSLKEKLTQMGIKFHHKAKLETLEKLYLKATGELTEDETEDTEPKQLSLNELRTKQTQEELKLVRVIVSPRDQNKKDWPGEVFTVANPILGTVRKFVPYRNTNGWHVPKIIVDLLRDKQIQQFKTVKSKNGVAVRQGYLTQAYDVTELPPLTEKELAKLASDQRARYSED